MRWNAAAIALCLWSAGAFAQTQVMVGARGGVTLPTALKVPIGPGAGVDVTVRMARLVAAEMTLEQSAHWVEVVRGSTAPAWLTQWTLGIQYRLDVGAVVPYATLAIEGRRLSMPARGAELGYGASFALGALMPLGTHAFAGVEARYGIGNDGAFPTRQTYVLRAGWMNFGF